MRRFVIILLFAILIPIAGATDRLNITAEIRSYSDIPDNEIYVGSLIYYNITIFNPNDYEIKRTLNISIIDEQEKFIHTLTKEFIIWPKKTENLVPYKDENETEYWLISPLKAGTYRLEITSSGEPIEFFENKTIEVLLSPDKKASRSFYRYKTNSIEFPFAVASQYERRLKEINGEQFKKNVELSQRMLVLTEETLNLNKELRDLTDTMTFLTWVILGISIIALFKKSK